jgi:large subunit ribosomal protein L13
MVNLTTSTKPVSEKEIKRDWLEIDVSDKVLGRVAPKIAYFLQGKHKVNYVSYLDMGDYVVVINAKKIKVTGDKLEEKIYTRYSGYPGGLKKIKLGELLEKNPKEVIRHAVLGMLPKNKLRKKRITRLYVFEDANHPYKDKVKSVVV